jgi:hypothetical protein
MDTRLVAGALVLAAVTPALAADRQVGKGKPYQTIQAAVDAAASGDRILVGPGVYRENVSFSAKSGLKFVGKGAVWDGRTSRGSSGNCLEFTADGVSVEGFTFRNGSTHVVGTGTGLSVKRCVSRNADSYGFQLSGGSAVVDGCRVTGSSSGAVYVSGTGASIRNNRLVNNDSGGVYVSGDTAKVEKNLIQTVEDDYGIEIYGAGAQVLSNRIYNTDEYSIYVEGEDGIVRKNVCAYTSDSSALYVSGDRAQVEDNKVTGAAEAGIEVRGDAMTVARNRVTVTWESYSGFVLRSATPAGGGTISDNVADHASSWGFDLSIHGVTVSGCTATECGYGGDGGFRVSGSGSTLTDCVADGSYDTSFAVSADGTTFTSCTAKDATGDGFQVRGPGNTFSKCTATACDGEGLDNGSTATVVTGCTFRDNRIDLANDATLSATFQNPADVTGKNTIGTGGPTTQTEVDF